MSSFSGFAMTGDSDVSPDNTASQFLLLRGLEPGVNEELVAKGVAKLYKSSNTTPPPTADPKLPKKLKASTAKKDTNVGAKEGSLRRVLLVRDRKSDESWRYAFAEFASVEEASAAMAKYNASEKFTIASKPVLVSYIHAGVFVPVIDPLVGDAARFAISPLHNPAIKLMYWDQAAYVKELSTSEEEAPPKENTTAKLAAAAAKEGLVSSSKDADSKTKKRKAEKEASGSNKKVVAPHLQFWTNRHAEIHGLPQKEAEESDDPETKAPGKTTDEAPPTKSYADMKRKCCLLCSRQFKTDAEVNKHERMSDLHRNNMKDESKVKVALAKLAKVAPKQTEEESSAYRDRAKERRQAFNQPKQPAPQQHKVKEPTPEPEPAPTISKGAALLGKMGWTAGEGLGAQGTGMTTAIQTEIYTQGVGLGAEGGKLGDAIEEAQRNTRGNYQDFIDKTRDKAKERYEAMN